MGTVQIVGMIVFSFEWLSFLTFGEGLGFWQECRL